MKVLRLIGNIIWFFLCGIATALVFCFFGLILCITVVGIPLAITLFKLLPLVCFPFGKKAEVNWESHPIVNTIWAIFFGWELFLYYIFVAVGLCIIIIGIPFAIQMFKFSIVALLPFGCKVTELK